MVDGMRIGIGPTGSSVEEVVASLVRADEAGFASCWLANIFGVDALSALALAGERTRRIELGTAVVPTHSRHPFYMAQQGLTTQAATGGRLALGLGPSHKVVIENMLGLSYAKPARHVREYVEVVRSLVHTGKVAFEGEMYRVNASLQVPDASPFPILIGGLGKLMRRIAGELADGTITWMVGERTLAEHVVPDVAAAARDAGRPPPRVVGSLPICLASEPAAARDAISKALVMYGQLPSYRAMLELEGAARPGDVALVGSAAEIEAGLKRIAAAGVTDLLASIVPVGPDPKAAAEETYALLAELARRG